jgi:signal transduction histidine kinase
MPTVLADQVVARPGDEVDDALAARAGESCIRAGLPIIDHVAVVAAVRELWTAALDQRVAVRLRLRITAEALGRVVELGLEDTADPPMTGSQLAAMVGVDLAAVLSGALGLEPQVREHGIVFVRAMSVDPAGPALAPGEGGGDLVRLLEHARWQQEELARLRDELDDTNKGVLALYQELDERALHLRAAYELQERFLREMTHEFRTPLSSMMGLTGLLLQGYDGELTPEQERQIALIRQSATDLTTLVDDLLELARTRIGAVTVRPELVELGPLFGALRAMMRPLVPHERVTLVFDEEPGLPPLYTDAGKLAQILRNLVSNALKFTEHGEVRVTARLGDDRRHLVLQVRDTGIGIPGAALPHVFEDFMIVERPGRPAVKGTGLGLPLSRRLAELLGGTLTAESEEGVGSTFTLTLPLVFSPGEAADLQTG